MAKTYTKAHPAVAPGEYLSYFIREHGEAASQTFPLGAPLIWSSGYLAEGADPLAVGTLVGIARRAGQNNGTAGAVNSEFVKAFPGMLIFMNLLTNAGATRNLVATDFGTQTDMHQSAVLPADSSDMWHASNATVGPTIEAVSWQSDEQIPNQTQTRAAVGDTDPRILFQFLDTALSTSS